MNRSLYSKLVLIILTIIVSMMAVAGVFLMRGVRNFYLNSFYTQMQGVFSKRDLADDLRSAADERDGADKLSDIVYAYSGQLGIDSATRNYYILNGRTGAYITGSDAPENGLELTPNIWTAIAGEDGSAGDAAADYMDVALPVEGDSGSYIIYIRDSRDAVRVLNDQLLSIIVEALAVGLIISVLLSLLLAKTMVSPIQSLTAAAKRVAAGDFSDKLENESRDEIGVLTRTFNDMAGQLERSIDEMRRSEQMRREFVANVSHELRTPITSVKSYAETLVDDPDVPAETRGKFLGVILNESDRMTKIVQDLLTLSRFDAGSIEFTFEPFSFERSVKDVYNATLIDAKKHNHEFILNFDSKLPEIRGDKARVEQVLINMVSNAVKYTKDGGRITMTAGERGGEVWCRVRDNGIGIPQEDVGKVFDRFYRVDKARSRESGGTGLGLSIANEIVTRHGGRMELKSREGKGTDITVYLPVEGPANE